MRNALSVLCTGAVLTVAVASPASADPPPDLATVNSYPLATGKYDSADAFYWKFFKTPDGRACGIAPNGQLAGCDAVPPGAPEGDNQTVVTAGQPGYYRFSDTPTFTRDVDVLPPGRRLENWGVSCAVDEQDAVTCSTYGEHGFRLTTRDSAFW